MIIELTPISATGGQLVLFNARFFRGAETLAELNNAPHEVATQWANVMKELHDNEPQIRHSGVCLYCGSTSRKGAFCGDCDRVFPRY